MPSTRQAWSFFFLLSSPYVSTGRRTWRSFPRLLFEACHGVGARPEPVSGLPCTCIHGDAHAGSLLYVPESNGLVSASPGRPSAHSADDLHLATGTEGSALRAARQDEQADSTSESRRQ